MEKNIELTINDPEERAVYQIMVTKAEYERALKDDLFAAKILAEAKDRGDGPEPEPNKAVTMPIEAPTIWTFDATNALIESMQSHFEDLSHPIRKKNVYENISNDLCSSGYTYTAVKCMIKWKSLLRSYKVAKDQKNKTGRGPSRFQFFNSIDEIVGMNASNRCQYAIDSLSPTHPPSPLTEVDTNSLPEDPSVRLAEPASSLQASTSGSQISRKRKHNAEIAKEARHRDRMEIEREKIQLLKKLIEKL